jgi:hypothetical protein
MTKNLFVVLKIIQCLCFSNSYLIVGADFPDFAEEPRNQGFQRVHRQVEANLPISMDEKQAQELKV